MFTQPPILPENATRSAIRGGAHAPFIEDPVRRRRRLDANAYVTSQQRTNVVVIDMASRFSMTNSEIKFVDEKGHLFYHDSTHLSGFGSELVKPDIVSAIRSVGLPRKLETDSTH